jgi:hypothetical protein
MQDKTIIVLDPTSTKKPVAAKLAPRLQGLLGKRLAVIWNGKLGGDVLLDRFSHLLDQRFKLTRVERADHRSDTGSNLSQDELKRLVEGFDAAIIGTGD